MPYKNRRDPRQIEANKKHYRENAQAYKDRAVARKAELKAYVDQYKDRPCADCGGCFPPYVMDLDHLPGFEKVCHPSRLTRHGSRAKLEAEIAKCEVVCGNCHRIRTHKRRTGE